MINTVKTPLLMGSAMGVMMLMPLHGVLTGETSVLSWSAFAFIAAHVAVALAVFAIFALGLTRFPKVASLASRLHRPSLKHISVMLCSAGATALLIHLFLHGGL